MSGQMMNADEILNFAIDREQEAVEFYTDLATRVSNPAMQASFKQFAQEEAGHKSKLQNVKSGRALLKSNDAIADLKISDYTVEEEPTPDMDYQSALVLAMKKEKAAFRLYSDLADLATEPSLKDLLMGLANEEAKHKLRFEVEYDEHVLTEN